MRPYLLCTPAIVLYFVLLAVPLAMTFLLSFNAYSSTAGIITTLSLDNYAQVFGDPYFRNIYLRTLEVALATTVTCALIGAPEAYVIARLSPRWRGTCLLIVLGPLMISVVVRTLGWSILLGANGLLNQGLRALDVATVELLFTVPGIVIALTHVLVPFMVLAVWTALQAVNPATERAALSLGAAPRTVFMRVVLPQIMPGVLSGSLIVFSLAASAFATPALIGGRRMKVAATAITDEFLSSLDWPLGAAIAVVLVVAVLVIVLLWSSIIERRFAAA